VIKVSDYIIGSIAAQSIKHAFLVTGGGAMHLTESLLRFPDVIPICNLHEQASAIAAENYSKATNHLGVVLVTSGPGSTNAITGVAGAWCDSTPMIVLSGQVKRADLRSRQAGLAASVRQLGVQEIDIVPIVDTITKYAVTVDDPRMIRYHVEKALYLAMSRRPGPVWIDIPLDVQATLVEPDDLVGFQPSADIDPSTKNVAQLVRSVMARLETARRPLILAGNGIKLARAQQDFLKLVDQLDIPVVTTWLAMDTIGHDHHNFVGMPGTIAPRGANFAVQTCDLLIAIGARLDRITTGYAPESFARQAHKIVVDIDPSELAKLGTSIHQPLNIDAGDFVREMSRQARDVHRSPEREAWHRRCVDWKDRYPVVLPEHRQPTGRVSVYYLSEVLASLLSERDLIVSGSSGSAIELFLLAFKAKAGQHIFHTSGLGAMGYGIAASIGACLGSGGRPVVCVDGDGGFQFNIQELETVARLNLPIKFFILNNDGYASIRASQTAYFGAPRIGCDRATGQSLPDLGKVARAYGLASDTIESQTDLITSLRRVLDRPGPVVCDVHVVRDEVRQPRQVSIQRADGSFESSPLEDLWPFLERSELRANLGTPANE
jgi:acetolactate synthase-1/2/3 large subunit